MSAPRTAAALIIGNEILTGKIADANLLVLARTLHELGISLQRAVTVRDDIAIISSELRQLSRDYDVVFTSGGVGPTHDDVTIDAVADAFDTDVVSCPPIEERLRSLYRERFSDGHLRIARTPRGARLVCTPDMPWPTRVMGNVWILPGIPQIFEMKMSALRAELSGRSAFVVARVHTSLDESELKPMLDQVVASYPDIDVGSYPTWQPRGYRTLITFDAADGARVEAARDALLSLLPAGSVVDE